MGIKGETLLLTIGLILTLLKSAQPSFQSVPKIQYTEDEADLVEAWSSLEKSATDAVQNIIKQALPVALRLSYEIEISEECNAALMKFIFGLRDLKEWAVRMVDAMGKPGGGQLEGTFASLGSYKECMKIKAPVTGFDGQPITGKYCLVDVRPPLPPKPHVFFYKNQLDQMKNFTPKTELFSELSDQANLFYTMAYRFGLCVPSGCSDDDIEKMANYTMGKFHMQAKVHPCEVPNQGTTLDTNQLIVILCIALFVILTAAATVVEYLRDLRSEKMAMDKKGKSICESLVEAFSIRANIVKVLAPSGIEDTKFACLNGMRFLSMGWVILIHTYGMIEPIMYRDGVTASEYSRTILFQIVTNSALSVDTFFFVTGLLVTYQIVKLVDEKGIRVFNIPIFIFRRIWRLLPSAMMILGLTILMPVFGYGPIFREETTILINNVKQNWWKNLLFISNFYRFEDQGLAHLWYISVDMQCFVLAMIFLFIFFKNPRIGLIFNFVMVTTSVIVSGVVTYAYGLLPTFLLYAQDRTIFNRNITYNHGTLHAHIASYAIGMWLGVTMARKKKIVVPKWLVAIGWPVILVGQSVLVFSTWTWNRGVIPTVMESIIYSSIHKVAWSLSLVFITTMCATGNAGFINSFLSWSVFIPLNRISYLVYLVHLLVVTYFYAVLNGSMDSYHIFYVWVFMGNVTLSHGFAFIMRIFYEAPLMELEKLLLGRLLGGGGKASRHKRRSRTSRNGSIAPIPHTNDVENASGNQPKTISATVENSKVESETVGNGKLTKGSIKSINTKF